jgi:hypothetical protein
MGRSDRSILKIRDLPHLKFIKLQEKNGVKRRKAARLYYSVRELDASSDGI